jgi:hypothetical protein
MMAQAQSHGRAGSMVKTLPLHLLGRTGPLWAAALAFVALALLAYFPYLGSGFAGDDFIFISMLEDAVPYEPLQGFWCLHYPA